MSKLIIHCRSHSLGEEPSYVCRVCGKDCLDLTALRRHERVHSSARPYRCPDADCGAKFTNASSLDTHRRQHAGDKLDECHICHKRFVKRSTLNNDEKVGIMQPRL